MSKNTSSQETATDNAPPAAKTASNTEGAPARSAPGAKVVEPLAWKLVGTSAGTPVTLLKCLEREEAEAQKARLEAEGYYQRLEIYPIGDNVPLPPALVSARNRIIQQALDRVGEKKAAKTPARSAKSNSKKTKAAPKKTKVKKGKATAKKSKSAKRTSKSKKAKKSLSAKTARKTTKKAASKKKKAPAKKAKSKAAKPSRSAKKAAKKKTKTKATRKRK